MEIFNEFTHLYMYIATTFGPSLCVLAALVHIQEVKNSK